VERGERDLVLTEPAIFIDESRNYVALPYQYMFLRADLIYCVAVIHDPSIDKRTFPVGESPFSEETPAAPS